MIATMKIAIVTAYDEGYAHCDNKRISLSQPSTTAPPAARTSAHRFPSAQMCFKHVTPLAVPQIHSHPPAPHSTSAHEKTLQLICVRTHRPTHTFGIAIAIRSITVLAWLLMNALSRIARVVAMNYTVGTFLHHCWMENVRRGYFGITTNPR